MNILVISECYPRLDKPFSGVYLGQLFKAFVENGNKVDVLIPYRNNAAPTKHIKYDSFDYYEVGYTTNKREIPLHKNNKQLISCLNELFNNKYDLVSVHITSDTVINLVSSYAKKRRIPIVMHFHGLNVWREKTEKHPVYAKYVEYRRAHIMKRMDALVGVSDKVCDNIRVHAHKNNVYTVYNGVNTELFSVDKSEKNDHIIRFVCVARLIKTKGIDHLIPAFKAIHQNYPDTELIIIGDGPEEETLKKLVEELELTDCVLLKGRLPYDEVSKALKSSDLFVLPSYYEALGCVYLEAMACGLPAIGVKGMGIDEIISDGENGYLVGPQNEDELIEKMKFYLDASPDVKQSMSTNARATSEKYTWHTIALELEKLYKKILKA